MTSRKQLFPIAVLALVLSLGTLSNCASNSGAQQRGATFTQVSTQEAVELMESEQGYVIVDVRTPEEFASGHIPGAVNVPLDSIGPEAPAELPDKGQLILVYCRSGNRSVQASRTLAELGYTNVVEFGGINSWTGEVVLD